MSEFYNLIKLCETLKTNAKIEEVRKHKSNMAFKKLFCFMLDEVSYTYNTKKIPTNGDDTDARNLDIQTDEDLVEVISYILKKGLNKGKELDNMIYVYYSAMRPEHKAIFEWIIKRKNPAKIGSSIVNKVWPKAMWQKLYMGAKPGTYEAFEKLSISVDKPALCQKKEDGMNWNTEGSAIAGSKISKISTRTRQGNILDDFFPIAMHNQRVAISAFINEMEFNPYISNEAMILDENGEKYMRREDANGLFNSMIKGEYSKEIDERIRLVAWDMCNHDVVLETDVDKTPVEERYKNLKILSSFSHGFISPVETYIVYSFEEARAIADRFISQKDEGAIVKVMGTAWKSTKPSYILKLKNEIEFEVEVIGWNEHTEDPSLIGSLVIASSCREMISSCGSGFNDKLRALPFEFFDGKIFTTKCEELTRNKNKNTYALKHPRIPVTNDGDFVFRTDKTEADTLETMLEIEKASKGVK